MSGCGCAACRSSKDFDARADLPVTPYHYSDMYVWLSLMINDGSQDFFGPLPLGGKVVPLGDGSVLSGGVEVVLEERDSWALECEGETPLAALQAYFSEESQRELLLDFWLMDASKTRCALVARDWGEWVRQGGGKPVSQQALTAARGRGGGEKFWAIEGRTRRLLGSGSVTGLFACWLCCRQDGGEPLEPPRRRRGGGGGGRGGAGSQGRDRLPHQERQRHVREGGGG